MTLAVLIAIAYVLTLAGSALAWSRTPAPAPIHPGDLRTILARLAAGPAAILAGAIAGALVPIQGALLGRTAFTPDPQIEDGKWLLPWFLASAGIVLGIACAGYLGGKLPRDQRADRVFMTVLMTMLWPISALLFPLSLLPILDHPLPGHPYLLPGIDIGLLNAGLTGSILLVQTHRWYRSRALSAPTV
jgi:hypothetical protein